MSETTPEVRQAQKTVHGSHAVDGAGVHLVRVIGHGDVKEFDPFLLLDAFDSRNPDDYTAGFPWHPHRGIETVTWLIEGNIEHGDSLGNKGNILDGGCQWMTAGSGIIHQEMPQASNRMLGLQLWINLPAKHKMTSPKYRDLTAEKIPVVREDGVTVKIVAGTYSGTGGAMQGDYVDADMLDIRLEAGTVFSLPTDREKTVFMYILEGSLTIGAGTEENRYHDAVLFTKGELVKITAGNDGTRFVLFSALPLGEPIAWGGPIVMNTREELSKAFQELDNGTFIK